MPGRVLFVFPATSYRADAYVAAARRLGVELVLATDIDAAARRFGLEVHRVSLADPEAALASLGHAAAFDGVIAADERSAAVAAAVGASLSRTPYHRPDGVAAARDKRLARARLGAAGVRQPAWRTIAPGANPEEPRFPCVVKPPMLSGSQGVIRADDAAELAAAVARVRRILDRHPSELRADPGFFELLCEDYVDGAEVAVEAVAHGGELTVLCIFDKPDPLVGPFFEETLYVTPSRHPAATTGAIIDVTRAAASALGLDHGPIHAELRLGPQGPVVLELAARSIGGLCSRALAPLCGSLEELLLRNALGEPPILPAPARKSCGVMMVPVPRSGVLRAVHGVEAARATPGIDGVEIAIAPGESVRTLPEGSSYLGFLFGSGDRPEDVEAALRAAHGELHFELSPLMALA
jgi:biotin carboxylase